VVPAYSTGLQDPGILICPTRFPHATLYVLASESSREAVSFHDRTSGKEFSGRLEPGRAALLLVERTEACWRVYNWGTR